jgi:hypothetical protein
VEEVEEGHPIWTNMVVMMEEVQEVEEGQQKLQHDEVRTMHS